MHGPLSFPVPGKRDVFDSRCRCGDLLRRFAFFLDSTAGPEPEALLSGCQTLANPQSSSRTSPYGPARMFSGLMSREPHRACEHIAEHARPESPVRRVDADHSASKIQNFTKGITMNQLHREIRIATTIATQLIGGQCSGAAAWQSPFCLSDEALLFDLISGELGFSVL